MTTGPDQYTLIRGSKVEDAVEWLQRHGQRAAAVGVSDVVGGVIFQADIHSPVRLAVTGDTLVGEFDAVYIRPVV